MNLSQLDPAADTAIAGFEPRIVSFLCNWCSYAGADQAGAAQRTYPHNVRNIRIMCSGRLDPQFVLKAFEKGADGVIILGCHPGDCHYKEQNYRMIQRHRIILRLLQQFGIDPQRCRLDFVSATEGEKFAQVMNDVVATVKALGPLKGAGSDPKAQQTMKKENHLDESSVT